MKTFITLHILAILFLINEIHVYAQGQGQVILYEGDGASQSIVCTLWLYDREINFKSSNNYGCENDETRSLRIMDARAGTKITLWDNPDGKTDDDFYVIDVLRDITSPQTVENYETNMETHYIRGRYIRDNGLNGKVSRIKITVPSN
eukprot:544839_1